MTQLSHEWLSLPAVDLGPDAAALVHLLIDGALAPLDGFMTAATHGAVRRTGRLPDGTPWLAPIRLPLPPAVAAAPPARLLLRDLEGAPLAVLRVAEVWRDDDGAWGGGGLEVLTTQPGAAPGQGSPYRADAEVDAHPVVALPVTLAPTIAATTLARDAAGSMGHVLLIVCEPPVERGRVSQAAVLAATRAAQGTLPSARLVRVTVPVPDDPRARQLLAARLARAHGATAIVLDVATTGRPAAALPDGTAMADAVRELGLTPIPSPSSSSRGTTDDMPSPAGWSWEARLLDGELPPDGTLHADVAAVLRQAIGSRATSGIVIFFTGLSGSGKSTIAARLAARLRERGRRVTLLDGDVVRRHLSSELGFSRAHRTLNIERIAFVAAEVARHGGLAICAPIAPYDATRRDARRMIAAAGGAFVLVHVDTPLAVCEARDRKGLYAKARAGLIAEFTGISDPYEPPADAEIRIETTQTTPDAAVATIDAWLTHEGYLPTSP